MDLLKRLFFCTIALIFFATTVQLVQDFLAVAKALATGGLENSLGRFVATLTIEICIGCGIAKAMNSLRVDRVRQ